MKLRVRIKPRAAREIARAAQWWASNRPAAPGAVRLDLEAALALLAEEPRIGTRVETPRPEDVRRLHLPRVRYFLYDRVRGECLEVVAFWHSSREEEPAF